MTYEEWLENIEKLKNRNLDKETLEKLKINPTNVQERLLPKILELIEYRFSATINNMMRNLDEMFSDENMLDLYMINFKKEILFLNELCHLPILPPDTVTAYMIKLKSESDKVYDIIEKEADNEDYTGYLRRTIKNNRIKWSE